MQHCQKSTGSSENNVVYHYIDVEKLIVDHIGKRIKKLTSEKSTISSANNNEENNGQNGQNDGCLSDSNIKSTSADDLKTKMLLYANVVTNNWVLSLITKEIDKQSVDNKTEKVFIVNLIPNRINLFRNCLYLRQAPSFVNFHFNYIAINLIKNNSKRKDLDQLASNSGYDEVNSNFINYFRLINKLIEVKVEDNPIKIRIKLTKNSKNSIKISTKEELLSFILCPKKHGMEIDISLLDLTEIEDCHNGGLMFVIKNEVEIEENQVFVFDDNEYKPSDIRKFTQIYFKLKESLKYEENVI